MRFAAGKRARSESQRGGFALRVKRRGQIAHHRRAFCAPRGHVLAHPLHAHGLADGLRRAAPRRRRYPQIRDARTSRRLPPRRRAPCRAGTRSNSAKPFCKCVRFLSAGPNRGDAVQVDIGDGAARAHRGVRLERKFVTRFHFFRGAGQRSVHVSALQRFLAGFQGTERMCVYKSFCSGKRLLGRGPGDAQAPSRPESRPTHFRRPRRQNFPSRRSSRIPEWPWLRIRPRLRTSRPHPTGRITRPCSIPGTRTSVTYL